MAQPSYPPESWDDWLAERVVRIRFSRPAVIFAGMALVAGLAIGYAYGRLTTPQPAPAPLVTGVPVSVAISKLTGDVQQAYASGQDPAGTITVVVHGADVHRLVEELNASPVDPSPGQVRSCLAMGGMPTFYRLRFAYSNGDDVSIAVVGTGCGPVSIWAAGQYADRFGNGVYEDVDALYRRGPIPQGAAAQRP